MVTDLGRDNMNDSYAEDKAMIGSSAFGAWCRCLE